MIDKLVIATGIERTGTMGIIGGVLHACGAWGGCVGHDAFYYGADSLENKAIRDAIVDPVLTELRAYPVGKAPLPSIERCKVLAGSRAVEWRNDITGIMQDYGYVDGPAFIMSASAVLLWPLWHRAFPDAVWIVGRRPDEDIVAACMKTHFMTLHRTATGWQTWVDEHKRRMAEMIDAGVSLRQIWGDKIMAGDFSDARAAIESIPISWHSAAVREFLGPMLKKVAGS